MSDPTTLGSAEGIQAPEEQNDDGWFTRASNWADDMVVAASETAAAVEDFAEGFYEGGVAIYERGAEEAAEIATAYEEGGVRGAAGAVVASTIDVATDIRNSEAVRSVEEAVDNAFITSDEEAEALDLLHRAKLKEQCFLMHHLNQLSSMHWMTTIGTDLGGVGKFPQYVYKKTKLLDGKGVEVMPKLTMKPGTDRMFSATPAELSNLVPMVKLNKIVYDDNGEVVEIPFKFYNHTITKAKTDVDWASAEDKSALENTLDGWQARAAVGIKSFDWSYKSGNPWAAEKDIDAKLVLYFQSMDELVRNRIDVKTGKTYRYLDLVVMPPKSQMGSSLSGDTNPDAGATDAPGLLKEYDSSFYEIKALVGWAPFDLPTAEISESFVSSIKYNKQAIFLTYTDHTFSIAQDGTFELTINYKSRIEGITESPKSNILFADKNILNSPSFQLLVDYEKEILELSKGPCADSREQAEDKKNSLERIQKQLKEETYKKIIENLLHPGEWYGGQITDFENRPQRLIYSLFITQDDLGTFAETAKMPEGRETLNIENITTSELKFKGPAGPSRDASEDIKYDPSKADETLINFFFLGDLLDMLFYTVFDTEKYEGLDDKIRKKYSFNKMEVENLKLLLGPMEFRNPQPNHELVITNIADIPISLRAFTEFFHRKVIIKERTVYLFKEFIKDVLKELVQDSLGENCFGGLVQPAMSMRDAYVSGPAPNFTTDSDVVRHRLESYGYDNPIFDKEGYANPVDEYDHFMVIHMQENGNLYYPGVRGEDLGKKTPVQVDRDRGIHHLHIGRDRGLLVRADFQKSSVAANIREARVENAGAFNPVLQLSDKYEVNIEMFGNTFFYPGSYLYLNPFGLGNGLGQPHIQGSLSQIMGLGGYHNVVETHNYIESGKFKTTVRALWVTGGNKERTSTVNSDDAIGDCPDEEPQENAP